MSAETTGFGHVLLGRPRRLDRQGILAFLRSIAGDRSMMLELRRLLAEELSRSAIFRMRDETVIEQLADRYVHGTLTLAFVRPFDVKLEGFTVEGDGAIVVTDQKNEAGELKPAPEIPPEYPVLARQESDQVIDSTLGLIAKLTALLFSTFGREKRLTTLGRELVLMAAEQSGATNAMRNATDAKLATQLHAPGSFSRPESQVPDAYVTAAKIMTDGLPQSAAKVGHTLLPLATVPRTNKRSSDETPEEQAPKFKDLAWSVDRTEVGRDVDVTFAYSGLEPGRSVMVTFYECNADGSRKRIGQEAVQVNAASGEQKLVWKRDPERAKADLAKDIADGDTGPVEYRFTVQTRGSEPSEESGPLWLTNTVTINLGGGEGADSPAMVVVLADPEKELRVLSKNGKATFEKVLIGPVKVWIEKPNVSTLTWSTAQTKAGTEVEASFMYDGAMPGMKAQVLVHDGIGRLMKEFSVPIDDVSGQGKVSFTRSDDEANADVEVIARDEDAGAVEYRFVVAIGGGESEPSSPLRFTHEVVLPLAEFNDGEPLPEDMEPVLVDADGTEYRGKVDGDEARFADVVCGRTTPKIAAKQE